MTVLTPHPNYANIQPRPQQTQYNQQPQFQSQHQLQYQPIQPHPTKAKPVMPRPLKPITIDDTHASSSSDSDDSDSESESDDDDSPPESSPIPPTRPTDAVEGLKFDTIRAVWAPRNKKASISTIRKAIMAYSDIVKAVRDTWKVRNEALKVAEQKADNEKLPLLRSEVASHRHVIDMVIMAAYDYGHPSAVHRYVFFPFSSFHVPAALFLPHPLLTCTSHLFIHVDCGDQVKKNKEKMKRKKKKKPSFQCNTVNFLVRQGMSG